MPLRSKIAFGRKTANNIGMHPSQAGRMTFP